MAMVLAEVRDAAGRQLGEPSQPPQTSPKDRASIQASVEKLQTDSLLAAVVSGNIAAVNRLLTNGTDVNARGPDHRTPLHLACHHGHRALCKLLLDKGADCNAIDDQGSQAFHFAAARGDHVLTLFLLENGADGDTADNNKCTPLHRAAAFGDEATIQVLLDHGTNWLVFNASRELLVGVARKAHHIGAMKLLQKQTEKVGKAQQVPSSADHPM